MSDGAFNLRGYGSFTETAAATPSGVSVSRFAFPDGYHAAIFASKIFSDFELTNGNTVGALATSKGALDAVSVASGGWIVPILARDGHNVAVVVGTDRAVVASAAAKEIAGNVLRRAEMNHPLYMDKWDRYSLGVWQGAGDYAVDDKNNTLDSFYKYMASYALNPQLNLGRMSIDGITNDNQFSMYRNYWTAYGVKFQFVEWLINQPDLYNRNPFLGQTMNPHVSTRWSYYGENRAGLGLMRDVQNATYAATLKAIDPDPNQMAILDPDGEIGPEPESFWGVSGVVTRREFIRFLRDVRKLTPDDVSKRYYGKLGVVKTWDDVTLADWRQFYGWNDTAVDLAGEWRFLRDDNLEGYTKGWAQPSFNDSDWVRLYYPGDALVTALVGGGGPLWMRKTITVDPNRFQGTVYLSLAPLSSASVQVFVNGKPLGALDPRFHTAKTYGQFDITAILAKSKTVTVTLRLAAGDVPNGPIFLTSKKLEEFPTSDPTVNARRWDHLEFVDWATAQGVGSTLQTIRNIDPNRPIKVHAYSGSPWGWKTVAQYGGYSHHTGSGPGWTYTEPKQLGSSRNLQDSSETGGPVTNLRDLKGLFGNLIFMGKNAHDYFISLQSITHDPAMRAYFEQKMPEIKVMGRANVRLSPIAVFDGLIDTRYQGEFAKWESWRFGVGPVRGGEVIPFLDEVRIREGNLNAYRVIMDPGTQNWDDDERAALRTYVQNGGILLLDQLSGESNFIQRGNGSGPGTTLAGVTVGAPASNGDNMTVAAADPNAFDAPGTFHIWNRYGYPGRTLVPQQGTDVIGTWKDGTAAMTRRAIGKGFVYFSGGSQLPNDVVTHMTATFGPRVYASMTGGADLLRTLESNNGCEDLLMVRGNGNKPATVTWNFDYVPTAIYDPVTGKPIEAKITGNTATFTVTIDDWDFRWFAARRPNAPADFDHWVTRQSQIWSGVAPAVKPPDVPLFRHLDLNHGWKLAQTDTFDSATALLAKDDVAAGLKLAQLIPWTVPNSPWKPGLGGLYRKEFDLPDAWKTNSLLTLSFKGDIYDTPMRSVPGKCAIYLNGTLLKSDDKLSSANIDVTGKVLPAHNKLEIVHQGGGVMASIMLVRSAVPDSVTDLAGTWSAVDGQQTEHAETLPGKPVAAFVYRDIVVPATAKAQEVWLRVDGRCNFAVINGRVRYYDMNGVQTYGAPQTFEIDITPDIRFGQTNRIAIGGGMFGGWHKSELLFDRIELAFYKPGAWSADGKGTRDALTPRELASVKDDLATVQLYPMVHPAVDKPAPSLLPPGTDVTGFAPPTPLVDLDLHPASGIAADRGPNGVPVTVKGEVEPITESGGKIAGIYLHGEGPNPGLLALTSGPMRKALTGKSITIRTWIKPIAINRSGGAVCDWIDYNFSWKVEDFRATVNLADPPTRKLLAESVIRQRDWQSLTLTLDGPTATLYSDGVPIAVQTWNAALQTVDAPFWIGVSDAFRDPINAKMAAFTIYPGAMSADDVAKLYTKEKPKYETDPASAWPENDLFRLAATPNGPADVSEIPSVNMQSAGVTVQNEGGKPYLSFSGDKSYIVFNDHPRARQYAAPFSLVWDMRRDAASQGTVFRHFHVLCLNLQRDGSLIFDANIGRHNSVTFPAAVPAGAWVRLMLTYDGQTVRLYRDGQKLAEKAYPGAIAPNDFPVSIFCDRTNNFPNTGNLRADLREYRLIPGILTAMP